MLTVPRNMLEVKTVADCFEVCVAHAVQRSKVKFTTNYKLNQFILATLYIVHIFQDIRVLEVLCAEQTRSSFFRMQNWWNLSNLNRKLGLEAENRRINKVA